MQGTGIREQGTGKPEVPRAPVRGTQSFVGVMAQVWKRPAPTAIEVLWRWSFGAVALGLIAHRWGGDIVQLVQMIAAERREGIGIVLSGMKKPDLFATGVALVIAWVVWSSLSAWGRSILLRKLQPAEPPVLKPTFGTLFTVTMLRVLYLGCAWVAWLVLTLAVAQRMIVAPLAAHNEPAYVPFAALIIVGTLVLFVLWMVLSYVFHLAVVLSAAHGWGPWQSLRETLRGGPLRGKLIEINLVMGIVKIALIVLAMVFSACPLPFASVESQTFLNCWWAGVAIWYFIASDYFHVVRLAAYLALWRVYQGSETLR